MRAVYETVQRSILTTLAGKFTESYDDFDIVEPGRTKISDPMLQNNWANIAISIRARNLSRTPLQIFKKTKLVDSGPVFDLFDSPNDNIGFELSSSMLWWLSSMWWDIEGEFFWWFGGKTGFPSEIHVLSPRRMEYESYTKKWFFQNDDGDRVPMAPEEFLHIYEPNIWNPVRGVPPLVAMSMELEQDWSVNKETLKRLNASAIPQGILKTDQRLTAAQANELTATWDQKYGRSKGDKRIAVLGQGTSFQALNENLIQYFDVSDRNKVSILTKYGIPLKVANATTEKTALSGKDSNEQYKALWSQTLIPLHNFWEGEIKTKFFNRFNLLNLRCAFDHSTIPELQEDEADLHKRLIADIAGSLLTPNEARDRIHMDPIDGADELLFQVNAAKEEAAEEEEGEEEDVSTDDGGDKKSFRRGTLSVLPRQLDGKGSPERGGNALSRFFGLIREG